MSGGCSGPVPSRRGCRSQTCTGSPSAQEASSQMSVGPRPQLLRVPLRVTFLVRPCRPSLKSVPSRGEPTAGVAAPLYHSRPLGADGHGGSLNERIGTKRKAWRSLTSLGLGPPPTLRNERAMPPLLSEDRCVRPVTAKGVRKAVARVPGTRAGRGPEAEGEVWSGARWEPPGVTTPANGDGLGGKHACHPLLRKRKQAREGPRSLRSNLQPADSLPSALRQPGAQQPWARCVHPDTLMGRSPVTPESPLLGGGGSDLRARSPHSLPCL